MRYGTLSSLTRASTHEAPDISVHEGAGRRGEPLRLLCIGGEDHALRLPFLRKLRARGFEVHVAANCPPTAFEADGFRFHPYAFSRRLDPAGDWKALAALRRIVADIRPDIAQSFDTKPNLYLALIAAMRPGPRIVRTINGTGRIHSSDSLSSRLLRPIYNLVQRRAARAQATTVFQNEVDKALFERKGMACPHHARLIRGSGIDVETFDRARGAQSTFLMREQLEITAPRVVMTVTRIEPLKGIRTLFAAADLVRRVDPGVQFVLVGPWENTGSGDADLRAMCTHTGAVRWIGPRSDVQALLSVADLFVLPTEYREGLPRVLLEAALAERAIITTDMPGCASVVQHQRTGLIVPPRAPGALAAAILELLTCRARPARILSGERQRAIRRSVR